MGILFGLPTDYRSYWPAATSYIGFFVVGFVCGIPVRGIYGVWRSVDAFAKDQTVKVNYAARWRNVYGPILNSRVRWNSSNARRAEDSDMQSFGDYCRDLERSNSLRARKFDDLNPVCH